MDPRQQQFDNDVQSIQGQVIHHQTEALASATAYSKMLQNQNRNLLQLISEQESQIANLTNQNLLQAQRIQELEHLQNTENLQDPQNHQNLQEYHQIQDSMDIFDPNEQILQQYEDANGEILYIHTNMHENRNFNEVLNSTPVDHELLQEQQSEKPDISTSFNKDVYEKDFHHTLDIKEDYFEDAQE